MSNLTRLQAVASSLDTAINKAESLPDASSGGASIETCTVTVTLDRTAIVPIYATVLSEGVVTAKYFEISQFNSEYTINNIVCGSMFHVNHSYYTSVPIYTANNGVTAINSMDSAWSAPTEAGVNGTLHIEDDS